MAAINAETGMVSIQAVTKLSVTPQRTADTLLVTPTPMIDPVIVCVVDTGIPKCQGQIGWILCENPFASAYFICLAFPSIPETFFDL